MKTVVGVKNLPFRVNPEVMEEPHHRMTHESNAAVRGDDVYIELSTGVPYERGDAASRTGKRRARGSIVWRASGRDRQSLGADGPLSMNPRRMLGVQPGSCETFGTKRTRGGW